MSSNQPTWFRASRWFARKAKRDPRSRTSTRALQLEALELRLTMAADLNDSISEAAQLGAITAAPRTISASINPDIDVNMYGFTVSAGQVVDFDIDTAANGPGGLGSYIRIFNSAGQQLAANNDAAAPGETTVGFDAYLRRTFTTGGTYYIGVSNANNTTYSALSGNGDTAGGLNSTGSYQLIINTAPPPPPDANDTLAEAVAIGAISTNPKTISSNIALDSDVNMYAFTIAAGQTVDFDIDTTANGPGGLGSYLRLFNSAGQQLAANNDAAAPGENVVGFDAYLRRTFTTGGTYFLGVSNASNTAYNPLTGNGDTIGGTNATGSYQLTIQALPVDTNDSLTEAMSLGAITSTPRTISATINPDIDVNMYRFTVTAGQTVDFDIDTAANGPGGLGSYIRIFNSLGQQLAANNDAAAPGESKVGFDSYLRMTFTTAGTYYIGVSNANNTTYNAVNGGGDTAGGLYSIGAYQLTMNTAAASPGDTNDTLAEATALGAVSTTARTVSSSIAFDTDVNMYSFTVSAGQTVDFDIDTAANGPGGLGSYIRIFNSAGQQLAANNDAAAPGENVVGFDAYLRFAFATAGTYYIGVSNVNNASYNPLTGGGDTAGGSNTTGAYTLTIRALPVDTNDSFAEATVLGAVTAAPRTVSAAINPDVDVNMYSFTVSAGQIVDFDIDTAANGPGGLGSYIRIFNSAGQQLAANNDGAAPGESVVGFDAYLRLGFTSGGTYYIGVSNWNNVNYNPLNGTGDTAGGLYSIGAYQLTINTAPAATLATSSLATAPPTTRTLLSTVPVTTSRKVTVATRSLAAPLVMSANAPPAAPNSRATVAATDAVMATSAVAEETMQQAKGPILQGQLSPERVDGFFVYRDVSWMKPWYSPM